MILSLTGIYRLWSQTTLGRQVLASAGETTITPQGAVSWTAGETIVGPAAGGSLSLNQGFQQPGLQIVSTGDAGSQGEFALRVFPNPTSEILHVERLEASNTVWIIRVFSVAGPQVHLNNDRFAGEDKLFSINLSALPAGQYILQANGEKPGETTSVIFQKIR